MAMSWRCRRDDALRPPASRPATVAAHGRGQPQQLQDAALRQKQGGADTAQAINFAGAVWEAALTKTIASTRRRVPLSDRFWSKVEKHDADDCWPWKGAIDRSGYGQISVDGKTEGAHRVSVILDGRGIPPGLNIDHACRNRSCVNPAHLRIVTPLANTLENSNSLPALNRRKTICARGHSFSGDNLAVRPNGKRRCVVCMREDARTYSARRTQNRRRRASDPKSPGEVGPYPDASEARPVHSTKGL